MRAIVLLLISFLLFTTAWAQQKKTVYTCPMHPEIKMEKPGKCPKCGMDLEKKTIKTSATKKKQEKPNKPNTKQNEHHQHEQKQEEKPAVHDHAHQQDSTPSGKEEPVYKGIPVNTKPGKTVVYHLFVTDTMVNYTGKKKHAFAINGTIPGPDLVFTEGDTAEIYLHNNLKKGETSLHWHGVVLPNQFDGVPYLTTAPVHPGDVHLYKFAIVQNGTYWYHSHSGLQEQAGIYGALIFKKRNDQSLTLEKEHEHHSDTAKPANGHHHAMPEDKVATTGHDHGNMQNKAAAKPVDGSYNKEQTVVLGEWTDEHPNQVLRRLRTTNDWYAVKKRSTQSYSEAIAAGHFATKITNEWKRMNAMDVSDVYYDRFLTNGQPVAEAPQFKAGDKVRLRIVNAGGSSYFWLGYGGGKMTVIANDGNDVVPVEVDRLIVGVSETYDVVVTIPDNKSYEFRSTPEDRTGSTSLWLGSGGKVPAPVLPRLKYFEGMKMMNDMMKMNGSMNDMGMQMSLQQMDMNAVMYDELHPSSPGDHSQHTAEKTDSTHGTQTHDMHESAGDIVTLNYAMLRSPEKTSMADASVKELRFELTGNMNRYVWSINNKIVREWDKILIGRGQKVRIILVNNSMMRHPMHLHGHDFRVLGAQGEYAPFKNVLDIMPMETDTIEFAANQSGDWFFHCHILYHMMAGMGNVFSYINSPANPELPDAVGSYNKFLRHESMIHPMAEIGLESNGSDGLFMLAGERYELRSEWRIGLQSHHGNEVETYFGRYFGKTQWWFPFIGFDYHRNKKEDELSKNFFNQSSNQNNRKAFVAGVEYTLPMLIVAQARVDSKGKFRFQLAREDISLTPRLRLKFMGNTDKEYMAGLKYIIRKWFAISTHYDSDMGYGAGITLTY